MGIAKAYPNILKLREMTAEIMERRESNKPFTSAFKPLSPNLLLSHSRHLRVFKMIHRWPAHSEAKIQIRRIFETQPKPGSLCR